MKAKKTINGTPSVTKEFLATVGESYAVGDVLVIAAGRAAASAAGGLATDTVLGIAASEVDTAVDGDTVLVEVNPDIIFTADYENTAPTIGVAYGRGTAAGAIDGDVTTNGYMVVLDVDTTAVTADVIIKNRLVR